MRRVLLTDNPKLGALSDFIELLNTLQDKFKLLNEEHNKLIQRWLRKAQRDADIMNATIESSNKSR